MKIEYLRYSICFFGPPYIAFVKFHTTRLPRTDFVVPVVVLVVVLILVLVPLSNSDFEDKDEKNQIRSPANALTLDT